MSVFRLQIRRGATLYERMLIPTKKKKETSAANSNVDWKSSLPLEWTRVKRDPKAIADNGVSKSENCGLICCQDQEKTSFSTDGATHKIYGQVMFCLHDFDPNWVQGYFLQRNCKKPWGLLAIQQEIDDCLACSAGGYRKLSLTVYHNNSKSNGRNINETAKSSKIENVNWTGGDMMTLYHPKYVDMVGERLLTGEKALPMLNKYFSSLINRLKKECCAEPSATILEWLPNVAIVTGSMSLTLPVES